MHPPRPRPIPCRSGPLELQLRADSVEKLGMGPHEPHGSLLPKKLLLLDFSKHVAIVTSPHQRETSALQRPALSNAWLIALGAFQRNPRRADLRSRTVAGQLLMHEQHKTFQSRDASASCLYAERTTYLAATVRSGCTRAGWRRNKPGPPSLHVRWKRRSLRTRPCPTWRKRPVLSHSAATLF